MTNWKDVMLHLGMSKRIADRIERKYKEIGLQKREAISWWMKKSGSSPWKELADALSKADYPLLATRLMLSKGMYAHYRM